LNSTASAKPIYLDRINKIYKMLSIFNLVNLVNRVKNFGTGQDHDRNHDHARSQQTGGRGFSRTRHCRPLKRRPPAASPGSPEVEPAWYEVLRKSPKTLTAGVLAGELGIPLFIQHRLTPFQREKGKDPKSREVDCASGTLPEVPPAGSAVCIHYQASTGLLTGTTPSRLSTWV
jgi:hypothetical protein